MLKLILIYGTGSHKTEFMAKAIDGIHNKLLLYGLELIQDFWVKRRPCEEPLDECRRVGSLLGSRITNKGLMYPDIHNKLKNG